MPLGPIGTKSQFQSTSTQEKSTFKFQRAIDTFNANYLKEPPPGSSFSQEFVVLILNINRNWENICPEDTPIAIDSLKYSWCSLESDYQAEVHIRLGKSTESIIEQLRWLL